MTGKQIQLVAQGGFAASPLLHGPCLAYAPTTPVGDTGGGGGGPGDLDHWAWIVPSGTQANGTPFDITLIAQDASNNTVTFYSGSATISMRRRQPNSRRRRQPRQRHSRSCHPLGGRLD